MIVARTQISYLRVAFCDSIDGKDVVYAAFLVRASYKTHQMPFKTLYGKPPAYGSRGNERVTVIIGWLTNRALTSRIATEVRTKRL